jgi:outer membrane protein assembly factor BamB
MDEIYIGYTCNKAGGYDGDQVWYYGYNANDGNILGYKYDRINTGYSGTVGSSLSNFYTGSIYTPGGAKSDESQTLAYNEDIFITFNAGGNPPTFGGYSRFSKAPSNPWTPMQIITTANNPGQNPISFGPIYNTPLIWEDETSIPRMVIADNSLQIYSILINSVPPTIEWIMGNSYDQTKPYSFKYSSPTLMELDDQLHLFIGDEDGYIYCFNAVNGNLIWSYPVSNSAIRSTIAVIDDNGPMDWSPAPSSERIFFTDSDGIIYCLDANPGDGVDEGIQDGGGQNVDVVWLFDTGETFGKQSPVVIRNHVYIGTLGNGQNTAATFYCLDTEGYNDEEDDGIDDFGKHNQNQDKSDILWYFTQTPTNGNSLIKGWGEAVVHHGKVFTCSIQEYYNLGTLMYEDLLIIYSFDEYGFDDGNNDMYQGELQSADILWMILVPGIYTSPIVEARSPMIADQCIYFTYRGALYRCNEYDGTGLVSLSYLNPLNSNDEFSQSVSICNNNGVGYSYIPNDNYISCYS